MPDKPIRLPRPTGARMPLDEHKARGLTEYERKAVESFQLDPGETVEGGIDKIIQAVLAEEERALAHESPVDPSAPPVRLDESKVVPLESLTPSQREEVIAKIREVGRAAAEARPASSAALQKPGMAAAVAAAAAPSISTRDPESGPAEAAADDEAADSGSGVDARPRNCPRCRLDLSRSDPLQVDRADKLNWLASLHGARFKKAYALMDGNVRIVFRSLTLKEVEAVFHQAKLDFRDRAPDMEAFLTAVYQYRLALSLESVEIVARAGEAPAVDRLVVPADAMMAGRAPEGDTPLKALREYVAKHVLASESLARVVGRKLAEFQRLVEWMEESSDNPDFMREISSHS